MYVFALNRDIDIYIYITVCEPKKKWIVHGQGALNINYSIFVFKFDVFQIS